MPEVEAGVTTHASISFAPGQRVQAEEWMVGERGGGYVYDPAKRLWIEARLWPNPKWPKA